MAAGRPATMSLVCADQRPSHYLDRGDGTISGMIEVESHLWAPREWELVAVLLWISDPDALRSAYEAHLPWPAAMDEVRPAYSLYTLMEWIQEDWSESGDAKNAAGLERRLQELCAA